MEHLNKDRGGFVIQKTYSVDASTEDNKIASYGIHIEQNINKLKALVQDILASVE